MIEISEVYLLAQNKKKMEINTKAKTIYFTYPNYRRFYQYNQLFTSPNALNSRLYDILKTQKDTDHILIAYIASAECSYVCNQAFMMMMNKFFSQSEIYSFAQPGYENTRMVRKYTGLHGLSSDRIISSELFLRCKSQFSDIARVSIAYITDSMYRATSNGIPPLNSLIISLKSSIMKTGDDLLYNQVNKIYFIFQCDDKGISFLDQSLYQVDCLYKQLRTEIRIYKKIRDKQSVASIFYLKFLTKIPMRSIVNTLRYQKKLITYSIPIMESIRKLLVLDLWYKVYQDKLERNQNLEQYKISNSMSSANLLGPKQTSAEQENQEPPKKRKKRKSKQNTEDSSQNPFHPLMKSSTVIFPEVQVTEEHTQDKGISRSLGIPVNHSFVSGYELRRTQLTQPRPLIQADYMKILSNRVIRDQKAQFVLKTTKSRVFAQLSTTPLQDNLIKSVRSVRGGSSVKNGWNGSSLYLAHGQEPDGISGESGLELQRSELLGREKAMLRLKEKYDGDRHAQQLLRELKSVIFAAMDPPFPVFLNVYNLLSGNFMIKIGLGFYHTAIQILGVEVAYGGHEYNETGVYSIAPKALAGASFIRSIYLGHSWLSREEIAGILLEAATRWIGREYDLLRHNCNDFTAYIARQLCGQEIPNFINRAARVGKFFVKSKNMEAKFADTVAFQDGGGFQAAIDLTTSAENQDQDAHNVIPIVNRGNRRNNMIDDVENDKYKDKLKEKRQTIRADRIEETESNSQANQGGRRARIM